MCTSLCVAMCAPHRSNPSSLRTASPVLASPSLEYQQTSWNSSKKSEQLWGAEPSLNVLVHHPSPITHHPFPITACRANKANGFPPFSSMYVLYKGSSVS